MRRYFCIYLFLGVLTVAPVCPTFVFAQTDADRANQAAEELRRQEAEQRRVEQERLNRERLIQPTPDEAASENQTPVPPSRGCLQVDRVTVEGVELFRPGQIKSIAQVFEGRCLGLADLNLLLETYTQLYASRGYIAARAYLPEQDVSDGELLITVIEGRLAEIEINGQAASRADLLTLFPGLTGDILNLRDIEQGLDQINRLPSRQATMQIRPGEQTGDTVLEVSVEEDKPWRATYHIDNLGSESTGKYKSKLGLGLYDLLGINEALNLSYDRSMSRSPFHFDATRPHGNSYSSSISVPLGYWTLSGSLGYSDYLSSVKGQISDVNTEGNSSTASATISRLIARSQTTKSILDLTVNYNDSENYILGSLLEASSRRLSDLKLSFLHSFQVFRGAVSTSLSYHKGLDWFGAVKDEDLPDGSPSAQFEKVSFSVNYHKPFTFAGLNWNLFTAFSGQTSQDLLFGNQQFSLGGPTSVRGTETGLIYGNKGVLWRTELGFELSTERWGERVHQLFGTIEPYVALAWGQIASQPIYEIEGGSLSGMGIGLRSKQGRFLFDIAYSDLIDAPTRLEDELDKDGVFYATMSLNF